MTTFLPLSRVPFCRSSRARQLTSPSGLAFLFCAILLGKAA
jgi:hypothetical protein